MTALRPCLRALPRARAFPASVFGPVLGWDALRRLASICAAEAMGVSSPVGIERGESNHRDHGDHREGSEVGSAVRTGRVGPHSGPYKVEVRDEAIDTLFLYDPVCPG